MARIIHEMLEVQDGLLVKNVPLMLPMNAGDKGLATDIGETYFVAMKKLFDERKAIGKLPRFKAGHADESAVIGRVVGMDISEKPWMYVDILTTDPPSIAKFKRGEMPSLSAEFVPNIDFPLLWGVACTQGDMGHFDYEKPDFMPPELTERLKSLNASLVRCAAPKGITMASKPVEKKEEQSKPESQSKPTAVESSGATADAFGTPANQSANGQPASESPKSAPLTPSLEDELMRVQKENQELLLRVANLEKATVKAREDAAAAAAKEFQPDANGKVGPDGKPMMGPDGKPLMDESNPMESQMESATDKSAPTGKPPAKESAAEANPFEKKLAADEIVSKGEVYSAVKRDGLFVILKGDTVIKSYSATSDKQAVLDSMASMEAHVRKDKMTSALTSLKDSGCPVKASTILLKLDASKTLAEMDAEVAKLASIPKWQDVVKGDGAKLGPDGVGLSAAEQVKIYLRDCDANGLDRKIAIVRLSREMPELYEAWTGVQR